MRRDGHLDERKTIAKIISLNLRRGIIGSLTTKSFKPLTNGAMLCSAPLPTFVGNVAVSYVLLASSTVFNRRDFVKMPAYKLRIKKSFCRLNDLWWH